MNLFLIVSLLFLFVLFKMLCLIFQLDYISRLMWQAQLRGHKTWRLNPPPECEAVCKGFTFRIQPGDVCKLKETLIFILLNKLLLLHLIYTDYFLKVNRLSGLFRKLIS